VEAETPDVISALEMENETTPRRIEPFRISAVSPFEVMVPVSLDPLTTRESVACVLISPRPPVIVSSPFQIPTGPSAESRGPQMQATIRTANTIKSASRRMAILAP
jgi:hypothetical protein